MLQCRQDIHVDHRSTHDTNITVMVCYSVIKTLHIGVFIVAHVSRYICVLLKSGCDLNAITKQYVIHFLLRAFLLLISSPNIT